MNPEVTIQRLAVAAVCALAAVVYAGRGTREQRLVVAPVALAIGVLVGLGIVAPVVAYGLLCLTMVSVFLVREERTRRRRVASLAPRPAVDAVPIVWIASAATSALMLTPYVVFGQQRAAALLVGACALVTAAISWRIASAPIELEGTDIRSERLRDRASRFRRAGLTAVLAIGIVFVFISFVNSELQVVMPVERIFLYASLVAWASLWAWVAWYVHRLDRLSCAAAS